MKKRKRIRNAQDKHFFAMGKFFDTFGYFAELPPNVDFDEEEYADLLLKCVEDNFDYTIELYGTIPSKPWWESEGPEIIID